jgi:hypothetical protein
VPRSARFVCPLFGSLVSRSLQQSHLTLSYDTMHSTRCRFWFYVSVLGLSQAVQLALFARQHCPSFQSQSLQAYDKHSPCLSGPSNLGFSSNHSFKPLSSAGSAKQDQFDLDPKGHAYFPVAGTPSQSSRETVKNGEPLQIRIDTWRQLSPSTTSPATTSEATSRTGDDIPLVFTFKELQAATRNFNPTLLIGEGGFGRVYYGVLDGREVAVKRLEKQTTLPGKHVRTFVCLSVWFGVVLEQSAVALLNSEVSRTFSCSHAQSETTGFWTGGI